MPLKGSLQSLAKRPKDSEGPAAITFGAAVVLFCIALLSACVSITLPSPFRTVIFHNSCVGIIASCLLTFITSAQVKAARKALMIQIPVACLVSAFLLYGFLVL